MKTRLIVKRLLCLALMVCMVSAMLPMLLVSAAGEVEITSPAYGALMEVGEASKIRISSAEEPTVTADGSVCGVTSVGDGVWDAAWTPSAVGDVTITASAGSVSDTVRVSVVKTETKFSVASDFTGTLNSDSHWVGVQGKGEYHSEEGYSTIALNGTAAFIQCMDQKNYGPGEGSVVWEADLRLPEDGNTMTLKHRDNSAAYEDLFILSPPNGTLYVPGDAENNWVKRFEPDVWFNLKTVFDMDAKTYTIYIDDVAISADNTLSGLKAEQGVDALFLQMDWYSADPDGSFDIKNYTMRYETDRRGLTITDPKAGSLQESGYRMPVRLTANDVRKGDTITVTGSDGAEAVATLVSGSTNQYLAYLTPKSASDTYQITAAMSGGGEIVRADAVTVKTAETLQLGAWDFNDPNKTTGIIESNDNFYAAEKKLAGDTVSWVGGIGGKDANDLAYQLTDNSTANNTATGLNFWPTDSVVYSTLIVEFDYYYTGASFAISTQSRKDEQGEIYVRTDGVIQHTASWTNIATIEKNQWYHMKAVFDKANNTFDYYLDGAHLLHCSGTYNKNTNPGGVTADIANTTVWMGCPVYGSGTNTWDNISIRALASDKALAKTTAAMKVAPVGAVKPGESFTVNAALPFMSEAASAYINGVKSAEFLTKNADGYYQGTITVPSAAGEAELTVVDGYGATATQTIAVKEPDAVFDFEAAENYDSGWASAGTKWMIWPTAMARDEAAGKLISSDAAKAGSVMIQANTYYQTGTVVIDFDATIPAKGTGSIAASTRQAAGNEPDLGYLQAGNSGYNDPLNGGKWVYTTNVSAGEQSLRYICDIDHKTLTLYIDGQLAFSYINPNITQFNALKLAAGKAGVANTLDNVKVYYLAPETIEEPPAVTDGVTNVKFTTGRNTAFTSENLSGIRNIRFTADLSAESSRELQIVVAAYEINEDGTPQLAAASLAEQSVAAGSETPIAVNLNLERGLGSNAQVKAFILSGDGALVPFASVMIP